MAQLRRKREELSRSRRAANTRRAYASDWEDFTLWCREARRQPLPASADTVALYLVDSAERLSTSTVRRRSASIASYHRAAGRASPIDDDVKEVLRDVARRNGTYSKTRGPKAALRPEDIEAMVEQLDLSTAAGARDRALVVVGFCSALRRSDLVALDFADVRISRGAVVLQVGRRVAEKNDQLRQGRVIAFVASPKAATCPVRAIEDWLAFRGREPGPLFLSFSPRAIACARLGSAAVGDIVKRLAASIGLNASEFAGHSLRAGFITSAQSVGLADTLIMKRSGHKNVAMVTRYSRRHDAMAFNPFGSSPTAAAR